MLAPLLALLGVAAVGALLAVGALAAETPTVTLDSVTTGSTTAQLVGSVDTHGEAATVYGEYATAATGPFHFRFAQSISEGTTGATPIDAELTGLEPETEYFFRLDAEVSGVGETYSPEPYPSAETQAPPPPPTVTINPASDVGSTTAHLSGAINPNGTEPGRETSWRFTCAPECAFGSSGPAVPPGTDAEEVTADLERLQPNTTYKVKLVAINAGGTVEASESGGRPVTFQTAAAAPEVTTAIGSADGESGYILRGEVNPRNSAITGCVFEFGPTESYGRVLPCQPSPGSGAEAVEVTAHPGGLTANAVYHYRVVATSAGGTHKSEDEAFVPLRAPTEGECPNEELRTLQSAAGLSDCRAYELVSPARKFGGQVGSNTLPTVSATVAADGRHVGYYGVYPFEASNGGSAQRFLSTRQEGSWVTTGTLPVPGENQVALGFPGPDATPRGSTPDGSASVYYDNTTSPHGSLWLVRADGSRVPIAYASTSAFEGTTGEDPGQPWFEGISADAHHIVFADTDALLPGLTATGNEILYEWNDDGSNGGMGSLEVVNRTNSPTLTLIEPGAAATLGGSPQHNTINGADERGKSDAISTDGARVYFQTPPAVGSGAYPEGGGPLYLREDHSATIEVSSPAPGYSPVDSPTLFQYLDASTDGRFAFFWANGDLIAGAPPQGGIYRYDAASRTLSFVATAFPPAGHSVPSGMSSNDGSHFYYIDGSLKLWQEGKVSLVFRGSISGESFLTDTACPDADVTPDGEYLAFSGLAGSARGIRQTQVYRYDAATHALGRVSVGPNAPANYEAGFEFSGTGTCNRQGISEEGVYTRLISDDGQYVFFDTSAALVPGDNDEALDAYEWRDGRVSRLGLHGSSVFKGGPASAFIGVSASGGDAFLATAAPLVHSDPDEVYDIYDARIDGGIASQNMVPSPGCSGETCQEPQSQPGAAHVASTTFTGPGNPTEHRQGKDKKRRHKKHKRRHKMHKKHKKHKTCHKKHKTCHKMHKKKRSTKRAKRDRRTNW